MFTECNIMQAVCTSQRQANHKSDTSSLTKSRIDQQLTTLFAYIIKFFYICGKFRNMTKRISPFTDFGFKYIFGQEKNKDLLIDFLNTLFANEPEHETIVNVTFQDKELPKSPESERGVIYDIKCLTSSGKHFIVKMQNAQQSYFIDRSIFYSSRSIVSQAMSGKDWRYEFKPVYVVSFLNFKMEDLGTKVRTTVGLCDRDTHKQVSDKIRLSTYSFRSSPRPRRNARGYLTIGSTT